jgi:predicted transcriptional regulator
MQLNLPRELETRLERVAEQRGIALDVLALEALERAADYDEWFIREVEKGQAAVDKGRVLTHEEMGARLERLLAEKQQRR